MEYGQQWSSKVGSVVGKYEVKVGHVAVVDKSEMRVGSGVLGEVEVKVGSVVGKRSGVEVKVGSVVADKPDAKAERAVEKV
jgi:hypothetical protein